MGKNIIFGEITDIGLVSLNVSAQPSEKGYSNTSEKKQSWDFSDYQPVDGFVAVQFDLLIFFSSHLRKSEMK